MSTVCLETPGIVDWECDADEAAAAGRRWHVLQTKSRQEKVLRENLEARGMRCFLPLVEVKRSYGARQARVE